MAEIIRTPTRAEGGITPEEREKMNEIAKKWIKIAMRTDHIDKEKITDAIYRLYEAANLKRPRVVVVPSPFVGRIAAGLAAAIWWLRTHKKISTAAATDVAARDATYVATDIAARDATYVATDIAARDAADGAVDVATYAAYAATEEAVDDATRAAAVDDATRAAAVDAAVAAATRAATDGAVEVATRAAAYVATYDATRAAAYVATDAATEEVVDVATDAAADATREAVDDATRDAASATRAATPWLRKLIKKFTPHEVEFSLDCISRSWRMFQGGNMWSAWSAKQEAMREVLKLSGLKCWEKYQAWEDTTMNGGFRYMHPEFCLVSDFPEKLELDEKNRPHCSTGPSHRWRDGFEIYHLHGVRFPKELYDKVISGAMPFKDILAIEDIDQRTQAMRYGNVWDFIKHAKAKPLDEHTKYREDGTPIRYWLYKFPEGEIFSKPAYYMIYDDLVPGTDKQYMSGVIQSETVAEAMAWKFSDDVTTLTPEQWLALVPGVDMN